MHARLTQGKRLIARLSAVALVGVCLVGLGPITRSEAMEPHAPAADLSELHGIVAVSSDDVWAVGLHLLGPTLTAVAAHFDGTAWTPVTVPTGPPGSGASSLEAVTASGPNDVWVVGSVVIGDVQQPLVDHWDGTSWRDMSPPPQVKGGSLSSVSELGPNNVWVVGARDDWGQYIEHWNGMAWTRFNGDPGVFSWDELNSVVAISKNDVWAVGEGQINPEASHPAFHVMAEHWDGSSWTQVNPGWEHRRLSHYLYGITAIGPSNIWAVGQGCCGVLVEHRQAEWRRFGAPVSNMSGRLTAVGGTTRTDVWAVGWIYPAFTSFVMHWNGVEWTRDDKATPDAMLLNAVSALSPTDAWAAGTTQADHQALAEHWTGSRWVPMRIFSSAPG